MKYFINDNVIAVVLNGKPYNITKDSGFYDKALVAIKENSEFLIESIVNQIKALSSYVKASPVNGAETGKVSVRGNNVFYGDEIVDNAVCDKMITFMQKGIPFDSLANFLGKLMENPSHRSVNSLYDFINKNFLLLDESGDLCGYKAVRSTGYDKHSNSVFYSVGKTVEMPRNKVDDNPDIGCSVGYHFGSADYVLGFGSGNDRYFLCSVNPKDVVSVPKDCQCGKLRTNKMKILQEIKREDLQNLDGVKLTFN
jgi:hypothetical protein